MPTLIHQRVEAAQRGENPTVICRVPSGWVVLSDMQLLRGYCLLLPDQVPASLNDMPDEARLTYLRDMALVGDAMLEVTGAARINYEILGNSEAALHVHLLPRYASEPDEFRYRPAWFYDWSTGPRFELEHDRPLMEQLAQAIQKRL